MSDRRVFPLVVEASPPASSPPGGSGGRQLPPPPKSPLYSVRRHHAAGSSRQPSGSSGDDAVLSGFDRMLMLRQMNVTGASSASTSPVKTAATLAAVPVSREQTQRADEPEVSAAQNLKQRREAEQRRRQEMALMQREDYLNTPEGSERLRRQEERALMLEEELAMRRLLEAEVRERRRQQMVQEQQEEARVREQYLAKMRQQREQQELEAREKELARKLVLEVKMKALKEAADAQAREEAITRQRQMERDALVDRERRVSAMETALMQLEDALAAAERQQWLAEMERQRQIKTERDQWRAFQEQEQAKLREATMQRRAAMAQQYEQDKRRKMEIHRLQQQQAAVVAVNVQKEPSMRTEQLKEARAESHAAAKDGSDSADLNAASVQSVTNDSPAMEATLRSGDLILDFGGVVESTPKCLLTVAECVQSHVNQAITVVVLRPTAPEPQGDELEFQECTVSLCPRKWKGKGLLGCQLSPFKWPALDAIVNDECARDNSVGVESTNTPGAYSGGGFVIYGVQADSSAAVAGLRDGDLLVSCGGLRDVASTSIEDICQDVRQAASQLHLEVERWLADEQRYSHLPFDLASSDTGEQVWGFSVTTYEQYYYCFPSASATSSALSACTDCYYSTTPSAIHTASLNGHIECLEALLLLLQAAPVSGNEEERASTTSYLEWKDDDGRTPLFYACYASQLESARFLMSHLGTFNIDTGADLYGDTPLHAAVAVGCSPMVRLLLESHYIDANVVNSALQTSAHVAPNVDILRLLESFDADMLATDSEGRMPLAYACLRDDPESVEHLCAAFPDFADYADERGNTPLHLCAWLGLENAARVLVRFLPPIALFLTNLDGCSPVELAHANGAAAVVDLLEQVLNR